MEQTVVETSAVTEVEVDNKAKELAKKAGWFGLQVVKNAILVIATGAVVYGINSLVNKASK